MAASSAVVDGYPLSIGNGEVRYEYTHNDLP